MTANRMLYLSFAAVMLAGVWLTGFDRAHWLLFVPIALAAFAGLTGFCVNLWLWRKLGFPEEGGCLGATKTEPRSE